MKRFRGIPAVDPFYMKDAPLSPFQSIVQPSRVTRTVGAKESRQESDNGLE
jgi:hypothetical protein